jgi:hypothetical protein
VSFRRPSDLGKRPIWNPALSETCCGALDFPSDLRSAGTRFPARLHLARTQRSSSPGLGLSLGDELELRIGRAAAHARAGH